MAMYEPFLILDMVALKPSGLGPTPGPEGIGFLTPYV